MSEVIDRDHGLNAKFVHGIQHLMKPVEKEGSIKAGNVTVTWNIMSVLRLRNDMGKHIGGRATS